MTSLLLNENFQGHIGAYLTPEELSSLKCVSKATLEADKLAFTVHFDEFLKTKPSCIFHRCAKQPEYSPVYAYIKGAKVLKKTNWLLEQARTLLTPGEWRNLGIDPGANINELSLKDRIRMNDAISEKRAENLIGFFVKIGAVNREANDFMRELSRKLIEPRQAAPEIRRWLQGHPRILAEIRELRFDDREGIPPETALLTNLDNDTYKQVMHNSCRNLETLIAFLHTPLRCESIFWPSQYLLVDTIVKSRHRETIRLLTSNPNFNQLDAGPLRDGLTRALAGEDKKTLNSLLNSISNEKLNEILLSACSYDNPKTYENLICYICEKCPERISYETLKNGLDFLAHRAHVNKRSQSFEAILTLISSADDLIRAVALATHRENALFLHQIFQSRHGRELPVDFLEEKLESVIERASNCQRGHSYTLKTILAFIEHPRFSEFQLALREQAFKIKSLLEDS